MRVQLADTTLFDALCAPDCDPGRTALIDAAGEVSFGEVSFGEVSFGDLRSRVDQRIAEFDLPNRSLVVLAGDNSIEWIVSYLALGRADHVPIFANRRSDELAAVWGAQGVVRVPAGARSDDRAELVLLSR